MRDRDLELRDDEDRAITRDQRGMLESAKLRLVNNGDFNLIDAFRVFDEEGCG